MTHSVGKGVLQGVAVVGNPDIQLALGQSVVVQEGAVANRPFLADVEQQRRAATVVADGYSDLCRVSSVQKK